MGLFQFFLKNIWTFLMIRDWNIENQTYSYATLTQRLFFLKKENIFIYKLCKSKSIKKFYTAKGKSLFL